MPIMWIRPMSYDHQGLSTVEGKGWGSSAEVTTPHSPPGEKEKEYLLERTCDVLLRMEISLVNTHAVLITEVENDPKGILSPVT
jgi:hypothetical protein